MNYIVDDIGAVVTRMQADAVLIKTLTANLPNLNVNGYQAGMPYYMFGHRLEIANILLKKSSDPVYQYQKYPLVALRLDAPEVHDLGVVRFKLNVGIFMFTDRNYEAADRYTNVFKPILYPIYESFLRQIKNAGLFMWTKDLSEPKHVKVDRPYWGTAGAEGNQKNIFNDPLDAIELIDLELTQNLKC